MKLYCPEINAWQSWMTTAFNTIIEPFIQPAVSPFISDIRCNVEILIYYWLSDLENFEQWQWYQCLADSCSASSAERGISHIVIVILMFSSYVLSYPIIIWYDIDISISFSTMYWIGHSHIRSLSGLCCHTSVTDQGLFESGAMMAPDAFFLNHSEMRLIKGQAWFESFREVVGGSVICYLLSWRLEALATLEP